jgi:hypothetical protein
MEKQPLSELSLEELTEKEKRLKNTVGAFTGLLSTLAVVVAVFFIQTRFGVAIPFAVVLFLLYASLKENKKNLADLSNEIAARKP